MFSCFLPLAVQLHSAIKPQEFETSNFRNSEDGLGWATEKVREWQIRLAFIYDPTDSRSFQSCSWIRRILLLYQLITALCTCFSSKSAACASVIRSVVVTHTTSDRWPNMRLDYNSFDNVRNSFVTIYIGRSLVIQKFLGRRTNSFPRVCEVHP